LVDLIITSLAKTPRLATSVQPPTEVEAAASLGLKAPRTSAAGSSPGDDSNAYGIARFRLFSECSPFSKSPAAIQRHFKLI
jgi:hypothetical protein